MRNVHWSASARKHQLAGEMTHGRERNVMAHTPEQRSAQQLCGARKKNGTLCRAFAGQGTDHPGYGKCKYHFGSSPSHRKHAAVAKAKQRIIESGIGTPIDISPGMALLMAVRLSAGHLSFIKAA